MTEITFLVVGVIAHWLKKLMERHQETGKIPNPVDAFLDRPYHVVWTSLMAIAGGIALYDMGQLTTVSAFLFGYCADSAAAALKRRVQQA